MGRSKFPGKPSKHVNKKRVNVLLCTGTSKNYVMSTVQKTGVKSVFSDAKQSEFNKQEAFIDGTVDEVNSNCYEYSNNTEVGKKTTHENSIVQSGEYERLGILLRTNKSSAFLYNYTNFTLKNDNLSKVKTMKNKRLIKKPSELSIAVKVVNKDPVSSSSAPANRKRMYSDKKPAKSVESASLRESERTSVAGKFVLPSRSLHSSRVIIPNKRFINHDQIRRSTNADCLPAAKSVRKVCDSKRLVIKHKQIECAVPTISSSPTTVNSVKTRLYSESVKKVCDSKNIVDKHKKLECADQTLNSGKHKPCCSLTSPDIVPTKTLNSVKKKFDSKMDKHKKHNTDFSNSNLPSAKTVGSVKKVCDSKTLVNKQKNSLNSKKSRTKTKQRLAQNHSETHSHDSGNDSNDMMVIDSDSNSSSTQWSCGKLVLRKARLQLHTQTSQGMDGPFTTCTTASTNLPGTVTCGVCGAVRFYRFVKQARKFNIYSCESCRKFISKMIKRQTCSKTCSLPTLECHKGQGMCHVPPIVRSQQWKLIRCAYKARCPACWLKMCLRSFQMPANLKVSLINMLPENMRSYTDYNIAEQLIPPRKLTPATVDTRTKTALRERTRKFFDSLKVDLSSKSDGNTRKETKHNKKNSDGKNSSPSQQMGSSSPDSTKRHKMELKGPRVKHVCRSASIVLGQPLATFSQESNSNANINVPDEKVDEVCEMNSDIIDTYSSSCNSDDDETKNATITTATTSDFIPNMSVTSVTTSKDIFSTVSCEELNSEPEEQKNSLEPLVTISVDYLDTFESDDDKVYSNGFGLIGSEPFSVQAVCLNCGSGGREQLIYCACCCEPYHFYCIDDSFLFTYILLNINKTDSNIDKTDSSWKYLWTCSRCTVCHECGNEYKTKTICQVCLRYYHTECMNSKLNATGSGPMICSSCFNCDNCGSKDIDKLICNLCSFCFKLKKNTTLCPICQKRNEKDDKVLQCSECKYLIHTNCEYLSDDMFEILKNPPCSALFVCRVCSSKNPSNWRAIISITLKNCYHIVLKSLSKHIKIRNIMKGHTYHTKQIGFEQLRDAKIETISTIDVAKQNQIKPHDDFDVSLKNIRKKLCIRECSVNLKNLDPKGKKPVAKIQNNKKVELNCFKNDTIICNQYETSVVSLLIVKRKVNTNSYSNVNDFQSDVEQVLKKNDCYEIKNVLCTILKQMFHWYDPLNSKTIKSNQNSDLNVKTNYTKTKACLDVIEKRIPTRQNEFSDTDTVLGDNRVCVLCNKISDGMAHLEGRLLYCGLNEWIHVNCAFWSAEVYEEIDCSLRNTGKTITYSRKTQCDTCKQVGASLRCSVYNCDKIVHYPCARVSNYVFRTDKSLFCPFHHEFERFNTSTSILTSCDFEIHRPVYVEIERTSKIHVELSKVQYLIGSLNVTSLGTFFPQLSDTEEAIIPSEFVCSRLFWSTVKPWKIIKYTITTSVIVPKLENINVEKNFTVDHSMSYNEIDRKINEIHAWKNEVEYLKSGRNNTDDEKIVSQVLDCVLEAICNKEVEDDEPQNTADLLPPDLKDAIFEDLPHDLLDGISMQDIFPKLMSYEDVLAMDMKNSDTNDCSSKNSDTSVENYDLSKSLDRKTNDTNDIWLEPKYSVHELNGFVQSTKVSSSINEQKLKRSKSEVFPRFKKLTRTRNHQRSCSLTWSCKLDSTISSKIKKRKICTSKSVTDISSNLFMVLDSTGGDNCDMLQELRLPEGVLMTVDPANADRITDTVRELKYCLEENSVLASGDRFKPDDNEPGKENKFRVWQNRQPTRILQVDGTDDMSSTASDSETSLCDFQTRGHVKHNTDEPVQCDRCQCTYRTLTSYNRHLETCDIITSDSDSEDMGYKHETNEYMVNVVENGIHTIITDSEIYPNDQMNSYISFAPPISTVASTNAPSFVNTSTVHAMINLDPVQPNAATIQSMIDASAVQSMSNTVHSMIDTSVHSLLNTSSMTNESLVQSLKNTPIHSLINTTPVLSMPNTIPGHSIINTSVQSMNNSLLMQSMHNSVPVHSITNAAFAHPGKSAPIELTTSTETIQSLTNTLVQSKNNIKCIITDPVINTDVHQAYNSQETLSPIEISFKSNKNALKPTPTSYKQIKPVSKPVQINYKPTQTNMQLTPTNIQLQFQNQILLNNLSKPHTKINNISPVSSIPTSQNLQKMINTTIPKLVQTKIKPKVNIKARPNPLNPIKRPRPVKPPPKRVRKNQHLASASTSQSVPVAEIQSNSRPTIIIQHLSNPNMMPAYVEAFQHQTGQNLQCIATIVPNDNKHTSYLTPSSLVPGTFHMQSSESTNYINIPNSNMSIPIATQPQSNIMGTLIQQSRPAATIHCGTMSTEQLLFSSVPNTIVTDLSGSMYYASEPVYYGFETIVQNTVMSSQQFVSTLPGVLESNSSYSATTTQVFQTSKIEPVEVNNGGYILVDQSMPQIQSPLIVNALPVLSQNKSQNLTTTYQPTIPELHHHQNYPNQISLCNSLMPESVIFAEPAKPNISYMKSQRDMNEIKVNSQCNKFVNLPEPQSTPVVSVAPYVSENGLPMNVVSPMPQTTVQPPPPVSKPTNPVLPMPSIAPFDYQTSMNKVLTLEPPNILNKLSDTVEKIQETLTDVDSGQSSKNKSDTQLLKLESASLKLIFQKQSNNGVYKISNKYISKNCGPIQIQPKPTKSTKNVENIIHVKSNIKTAKKDVQKVEKIKEKCQEPPDPNPNILYNIHSQDGFDYSSTSITDLWRKVFEAVQEARASHNMPPLSENAFNKISGLQLMGLNSNGLRYLIEQLPGVGKCIKYKPVCYKKPLKDLHDRQDPVRTSGSARCEPYTFTKRPYDMFRWLASKHRNPEYVLQMDEVASRRPSSINLPMAMRFRQLKGTSKNTVGVYRSNIHGRGLFCLKDIECAEMVIEYAGEVIRSTLTDKREKHYNSKEIGCYMFRVDDNLVIDATMKGNAARFINHSCDPNCYSRVLDILGHKHILIFALRKILQGEELTYDYKFPFEEDKIPCTCGSKKCRKYLN